MMRTEAIGLVAGVLLAAAAGLTGSARATNIAIDLPRNQVGNQTGGYSLGEDFTVASPGIRVTDLAAFDPYDPTLNHGSGGNVPLGTGTYDSIPVAIYYTGTTGQPAAGTLVPGLSATITDANSHFVSATSSYLELNSFSPVVLAAGTYRLVASNYNNESEYNTGGTGTPVTSYSGPLITFPTNSVNGYNNYYASNNATAAYPTGADEGLINRYGAGSFTFLAAPEPSSLALGGLGAIGLFVAARRRRKA